MFEHVLFPLFSTPLVVYKHYKDVDILEEVKNKYAFRKVELECSRGSYISENLNVLNDYPFLKKDIINYFNHYKTSVMRYDNTEFEMTTSWFTKAVKDSFSHFHNHTNSMFSGVFYLTDDNSPIEFESNIPSSSFLIMPKEKNIYNSETWMLYPEKNMMVFFPSSLRHRIGYHSSDTNRYSIAFNFFPTGQIGIGDSSINITIN